MDRRFGDGFLAPEMLLDSETVVREALERGSCVLVLAQSEYLDHHKPQKLSDIQPYCWRSDPIREGVAETLDSFL